MRQGDGDGVSAPPRPGEASGAGAPPTVWSRLLAAIATPQVLVAAVLALGALSLVRPNQWRPAGGQPVIDLTRPEPTLTQQDVRLVIVDAAGLERSRTSRMELPERPSRRLATIIAALREELVQEGVWPVDLPAPRVFVETFDRQRLAVIDMQVPTPVGVSVAQELALLRSLTSTAEANGVAGVRFLRDGEPTATLLGHVAVPASL